MVYVGIYFIVIATAMSGGLLEWDSKGSCKLRVIGPCTPCARSVEKPAASIIPYRHRGSTVLSSDLSPLKQEILLALLYGSLGTQSSKVKVPPTNATGPSSAIS
jgi:hypothetical protein